MAAMTQLAWLGRKASGMAMRFSPMDSEPFAFLLKLVTSHPDLLAHGPELFCPIKVNELIGFPGPAMLAGVAANPVIIQKKRQCNQCNSATSFLNLFICVLYVCIWHISTYIHFI